MQDCKPVCTPVDVNTKLTKATDEEESVDQQQYQSAIGSLMYLSISTRPDIAGEVNDRKSTSGYLFQMKGTKVLTLSAYGAVGRAL